jgi:hypothetical protein
MVKKGSIILMLIVLGIILLILSLNMPNLSLTSLSISSTEANILQESVNLHAWTKAICNKDNFCQDYLIECNDQETLKITPIAGSMAQFDASWQDPRTLEQRERLCG